MRCVKLFSVPFNKLYLKLHRYYIRCGATFSINTVYYLYLPNPIRSDLINLHLFFSFSQRSIVDSMSSAPVGHLLFCLKQRGFMSTLDTQNCYRRTRSNDFITPVITVNSDIIDK